MKLTLYELFEKMLKEMGPLGWWPAESKEEIIIGAILVQNTNWLNVTRSLENLRNLTGFEPDNILKLDHDQLKDAIRPSGFYKNKSRAISDVFKWLESHNVDYDDIQQHYQESLRKKLLSLHGIGEETADVFLLYIFDQPVFIADSYARRLFSQLNIDKIETYTKLKRKISELDDFSLLEAKEFHGLIDEFGKVYLRSNELFERSFLFGDELIL